MNVILSIKPQYVQEIISGRKKFEFRKKIFKRPVEKVYVYSSAPICKVVGEFLLGSIISGSPSSVWRKTHDKSGISKNIFERYFEDRAEAFALEIKDFKEYCRPIEGISVIPNFTPPQSYRYVGELNLR